MAVGEQLTRKKITAADLPEELLHREILTRLPIKSVVRFKCVSKSWLSLFSKPQFVKEHLTHNTTRNPNDYDCLVAKKNNKIVMLSRYKETFALPSERIRLVGCVRGLVCLLHKLKLSLWNPAIHQSKEFSLPPSRCCDYMEFMGFGYDAVSDNYKVVVLSSDVKYASVYCSNSDSWIDVFVPHYVRLFDKSRCFFSTTITIVKGCPYWKYTTFVRDPHGKVLFSTKVSLTLVKFDAGSNKFKLLPEFRFDTSGRGESCAFDSEFVDMNDCLSLIVYDRESSKCMLDIYSLDGEEGCCVWSKMYTIGPLDFHRRHWFVSQGFYSGEIVVHDDDGIFSCYDQKTDTIMCPSTTSTTASVASVAFVVTCFRYTPSLVFLEGMKSVYLTTQTRRTSGPCYRVPRRLINSLKNKVIPEFSLRKSFSKCLTTDSVNDLNVEEVEEW